MKICPKCHQTYDKSIDFCLKDGNPLVDASRSSSDGSLAPGAASSPHESQGRRGRRHLAAKSVLQSVEPPEPVGEPKIQKKQSREQNRSHIAPPLLIREAAVGRVRISMPADAPQPKPPWELVDEPPSPPSPATPPEPSSLLEGDDGLSAAEDIVRTPDIPEPPPERSEVEPVGDETVLLELDEDEGIDLMDSLELVPVPEPPPEPEIPLESRLSKAAAIPRPSLSPDCPAPPVLDEPAEQEERLAIVTEEEADISLSTVRELGHSYRVIRAGAPLGDEDEGAFPPPRSRVHPILWGMIAAGVLGIVFAFFFVPGREFGTVVTAERRAAPIEEKAVSRSRSTTVAPSRSHRPERSNDVLTERGAAPGSHRPRVEAQGESGRHEVPAGSPLRREVVGKTRSSGINEGGGLTGMEVGSTNGLTGVAVASPSEGLGLDGGAAVESHTGEVSLAAEPGSPFLNREDVEPSGKPESVSSATPKFSPPPSKKTPTEKAAVERTRAGEGRKGRSHADAPRSTERGEGTKHWDILINANRSGGKIFVDGRFEGIAPQTISLPGDGVHRIRVEVEGQAPQTRDVNVNPNKGPDPPLLFFQFK